LLDASRGVEHKREGLDVVFNTNVQRITAKRTTRCGPGQTLEAASGGPKRAKVRRARLVRVLRAEGMTPIDCETDAVSRILARL
jgi:hypothetical protein